MVGRLTVASQGRQTTAQGAWSGSRDLFLNFGAPVTSLEWVKGDT